MKGHPQAEFELIPPCLLENVANDVAAQFRREEICTGTCFPEMQDEAIPGSSFSRPR